MPDFKQMLTQVKQMQEQLQERLEKLTVEASAGGGLVTARMNGQKQLLELRIDPEALSEVNREMLQDLVMAAVNEASRRVDQELQQQVSSLAGGFNPFKIPGLF
ncbi:MAG: YbaB/EbfC family nucleoid-associated protein [Candidatus Acidoferrales bacterium]|nr:YbaB/EbfC family nucleoid-associated protein [Acidobacteriia bacterium AH_259_A11_L15]